MTRTRSSLETDIERHIAAKIRERRIMLGQTRQQLASRLGITYQQLHKYETGQNRVTAGRLAEIGRALEVAPTWFFEELVDDEAPTRRRNRRLLELSKLASGLDDRRLRALAEVARALSEESEEAAQPVDEAA